MKKILSCCFMQLLGELSFAKNNKNMFLQIFQNRSEGGARTAHFFLGAFGRESVANSRFRRDPARPDREFPFPSTGHFDPRLPALKTADLGPSVVAAPAWARAAANENP